MSNLVNSAGMDSEIRALIESEIKKSDSSIDPIGDIEIESWLLDQKAVSVEVHSKHRWYWIMRSIVKIGNGLIEFYYPETLGDLDTPDDPIDLDRVRRVYEIEVTTKKYVTKNPQDN